jgi:hypothetical protein
MGKTFKHKAKGKFNNGLLEEPDNTYERMADRHNKKRGEFRKVKKDLEEKIAEKELKEEKEWSVLEFGKHKGLKLNVIKDIEPKYLTWLYENTADKKLKEELQILLKK